jgi:DegV family protein with EDD domain
MPGQLAVAVVTDSTSDLPEGLAERHRITVVPLQVATCRVEVGSAEVAQALSAMQPVTTSRPSPVTFAETFRRLAGAGAGAIVSIHLSGELSGTVDAARVAAREVAADGVPVEVVDSRSLGLGLGFAALAVARAVAAGKGAQGSAEAGARCAYASSAWLYVDTLEYLRRGGRISPAAAMLGSALAVKPILHLVDGRLEVLERVRTASKALARLEELVVEGAGDRSVDVGVQHLAAADRAGALAERLRERVPRLGRLYVSEVGAVVGAHVGPGMIGVVIAPGAGPDGAD